MDVRLTWTDCDEAGDYVVPNVLSPRDLVSRPDNMDETVLHTCQSSLSLNSLTVSVEERTVIGGMSQDASVQLSPTMLRQ